MRIWIKHDENGRILNAMKAVYLDPSVSEPFGSLSEGEGVIHLDPTPGLETIECHDFAERFAVDVRKRTLEPQGHGHETALSATHGPEKRKKGNR